MKPLMNVLFFLFVFAHIITLHAEPPSEDSIKKVIKLSSRAALSYDKGAYTEALSLYRKAHALWASPKLSFAIVKCLESMKRYREALRVAQRGLQEKPKVTLKKRLESKIKLLKEQLSKGFLKLLITPSGTQVKIDGNIVGASPLDEQTLSTGSHKLELTHPNYASVIQKVAIQGGQKLNLKFALQAVTGTLSVTSNPSGANVQIDGKSWGVTPLSNLTLPTGSHSVKVTYKGYLDTIKKVKVTAKQSEKVTVVLSPKAPKETFATSWPKWTVLILGIGATAVGALMITVPSIEMARIKGVIKDPSTSTESQQELDRNWKTFAPRRGIGIVLASVGVGLIGIATILFVTKVGVPKAPKPKTSTKTTSLQTKPELPHTSRASILYATP